MEFYLTGETYRLTMAECQDRRSRLRRGSCLIREDGTGTYTFTYLATSPVQHKQRPYILSQAEHNEASCWLVRQVNKED